MNISNTPYFIQDLGKYRLDSILETREQYQKLFGLNLKQIRQIRFSELQKYRFNAENSIEKPQSVISIGEHVISTKGNIITLAGPPKAGKSALIAAILSGTLSPSSCDPGDLLGLTVKLNDSNKAVLHIDSEQSRYDHYKGISGLLKRTTSGKMPEWFHSYNFRTLDAQSRKECLQILCEETYEKHGGMYMVILDGGADFVLDTNDQKESNEAVRFFEELAAKYDCPIVIVLHFNPGTEKGRGHFGSQLERKSESVISVSKNLESEISTIKGKLLRNSGSIPQIQFIYDLDKGHHVYYGTAAKMSKADEKILKLQQLAEMISKETRQSYTYTELYKLIMEVDNVSKRTAQERIVTMLKEGLLIKSDDVVPMYSVYRKSENVT
jgi:hypothetical protein